MENQDHRNVCKFLGYNDPAYCDEKSTCQDTDRCSAFYWLEKYRFRKFIDPSDLHQHLIEPFYLAVDEAWFRYPDVNDPKQSKNHEKLIISRLKKANEEHARQIEADSRRLRKEAENKTLQAQAVRRSEPKGPGRFPPGWMLDASKGSRGARELMMLLTLIKEVAKKGKSDQLIDEFVASGRSLREEIEEHYTDKNGKARSWPLALFQMDYERAAQARGWKKDKVRRLLKLACKAGVIYPMAKSPAENGQMVYCAGVWQSSKGMSWIRWLCKGTDYWISVFRNFKST